MKKLLVYISGPMSTGGGELTDNIYKGALVARKLMEAGYAVICPQLTGFVGMQTPAWPNKDLQEAVSNRDHDLWLEMDKRLVEACDILYRMPGSSEGVDIEVKHAETIHRPVVRDLGYMYLNFGPVSGYDHLKWEEMRWLQNSLNQTAVWQPGDPANLGNWTLLPNVDKHGKAIVDTPEDGKMVLARICGLKEETVKGKEAEGYVHGYTSVTGGLKDSQEGRGDFSLLPYEPLRQVAEHLRVAAEKKGPDGRPKYARNNWRKGIGLARIVSALRRHSAQLGEDNDDYHLAAILAEAFFACQLIADIKAGRLPKELDDVDGPFKALDWKVY